MENIYEHLSSNELSLHCPPAPRKVHVRKMIKVSSRVRRKLIFDDGDDEVQASTPKKVRLGSRVNLTEILCSGAERLPSSEELPGGKSSKESINIVSPLEESSVSSNTQTNISKLSLKFDECHENMLLVDNGGFTTPDKCVCKITREPSEFVSRFKRPLRL